MKTDKLHTALTEIDPALVARAANMPKTAGIKRRKRIGWISAIAALLAIAIILPLSLINPTQSPYALSMAIYPEMARYPGSELVPGFEARYEAWRESQIERRSYFGKGEGLEDFFSKTASAFLGDGDENLVYSPLNVYFALAMLAEISEGETRNELLTLLSSGSIEALRTQAHAIWNANYCDDGSVTSILASSLWLDQDMRYNEDVIKTLTDRYYASSFQGEMGDKSYSKAFQNWLNRETGGLLKDYIDELEFSPQTVMAIATTILFQAKWDEEFKEKNNETMPFHAKNGDLPCEFMKDTDEYGRYYWAEKFSATRRDLEESGAMYFILPDEGVTVQELLKDSEALAFLTSNGNWENQKMLRVNLALPKFEVSSKLDLAEGLKSLGVTSCFDPENADFSALLDDSTPAWLDKIEHGASVSIDEEGVTAAAYTAMMLAGNPMPPEDEIDFTLDRPFLFVITGVDGLPLFIGTVQTP